MSYVPVHDSVYLRAFSGCLAGLGAAGKYLSSPDEGAYYAYARMADSFAQCLDTNWGETAPTQLELNEIAENSEAVWENRSPFPMPDAWIPGAYTGLVNGVIALARAGNTQVVNEGIDPNAGQGAIQSVTGEAPIDVTAGPNPVVSITAATQLAAGSMSAADKAKLDSLTPSRINVLDAPDDGIADATPAWSAALAALTAAGGGSLIVPKPAVTYKLTDTLQVTANISIVGLGGTGSIETPDITLYGYGKTIFNGVGSRIVVQNLSGQYGPTTTLNGATIIGATSLRVQAAGTIAPLDWLILDQYPHMEQVQVDASYAGGTTIPLATALTIAHSNGAWVRDQATVTGPSVYNSPPRDLAGFCNFTSGNDCSVINCAVLAMVTGVKFRGEPSSNTVNNGGNGCYNLSTNYVQFGVLAQQQTNFRNVNPSYRNATGGQTTAPGHGTYMTGLTGLSGAWSGATTYSLYQQVSYSGNQYISLSAGNLNHQPDVSPAFWSLQPGGAQGWRSKNKNVFITDTYGNSGLNFKDWSAVKVKFTDGGAVLGTDVENCVRGFDFQEFNNGVVTGASLRNFIPPISADSSAAAIDSLDCNNLVVTGVTVDLRQADGTSIDMPVVLDRVGGTTDNLGELNGRDNKFEVDAVTNYSAGFTSAAFRTQCLRSSFSLCKLREMGGQNPYAFNFAQNTTFGTFANGCTLIRPTVVGTTHIATVSTGTTSGSWDIDNNLIPASPVFNDTNLVIESNLYVTNVAGTLGLSPTSTANDVITINLPVASSQKALNIKNSAGNSEVAISNSSGLKTVLLSSVNGNGSYLGVGLNVNGGFPSSGATFGGYTFTQNNNGISNSGAGIFAIAAENQGVGALGTDLLFQSITPGGSTAYKNLRLYGSGDVVVNATGNALATNATSGFFFMPSMAGPPTGTVTGHTGTTPFVWDSVTQTLMANIGSGNWREVKADTVAASGPVNGTTFTPGSIQRLGSGQSGNSYVLPDATKCPGSRVVIKITNNGANLTYTLTAVSGNIEGAASFGIFSNLNEACYTFESDGTNWWLVAQSPTNYSADSPGYHGFVEWNEQPAYNVGGGTLTSQTLNLMRLVAGNGGLVSNIVLNVSTLGSGFTAATTAAISNVTNNGSGLCRITAAGHGFSTNDILTQAGIVGATEANTADVITVIDANTYDLNNTAFTSAYVSGGTATRSANTVAIYDSTGAFLTAAGDQAAVWNTTGLKTMTLAKAITLTKGKVYYVAMLFNGTAATLATRIFGQTTTANAGLSNSTLRWASAGTAVAKLPASFSPAANAATNAVTTWIALS